MDAQKMTLLANFKTWERALRKSYNTDLSTPENRRKARIYTFWFDHAILRTVWSNFYPVATGVYRSNHPTHRRLEKMKAMGIKTVLNLRGGSRNSAPYHLEAESCAALGLTLVNADLHAREAASRDKIIEVLRTFRAIEKPFVMHCKSGADRASFASAMYLLCECGASVPEARRMLSPRYIHFKWTRTGVLDHILDLYEARQAETGIAFEDWIASEYDADTAQAGFDAKRQKT